MFSIPLTTKWWNIGYLKIPLHPLWANELSNVCWRQDSFFYCSYLVWNKGRNLKKNYCSPLKFGNAYIPIRNSLLFNYYVIVIIYLHNVLSICGGNFSANTSQKASHSLSVSARYVYLVGSSFVRKFASVVLVVFRFALANLFFFTKKESEVHLRNMTVQST